MNDTMLDLTEATFVCPGPSGGSAVGLVTKRLLKAVVVITCGVTIWVAALSAIL